ncbi:MAG: HDOD domain-containing protein [Gammaproteobacteria bacterium]|jgi:putative nucleotidyltransferase with HDIG domain
MATHCAPAGNAAVEAALSKVSRLATLPEITTRIIEIVDNPNATANELEKLVSSDPVLSARVLKVVNSSFYGLPASVNSIKQAIVLLGMGGLKNIAIAASLAKLFGGMPTQDDFDPQGPWQHSAAVAAAAKLICDHIDGNGEEMFLAGLLHDVGTVIALQAMRREFGGLVERRSDKPDEAYETAERLCLGATHEEFGIALCRSWNFPDSIQAAVAFHHDPDSAEEEFRHAARIICIADHIAAECGIGYCSVSGDQTMPADVLAELGLDSEQLDSIRERVTQTAGLAEQIAA